MKKAYDFLIVGQGLAGTSLAQHLLDAGASVLVMDDRRPHSSSRVAAGLFNPVTGRKMVRTWKAEQLFPYLTAYYRSMEELTKTDFLFERPIYRPFLSVEEQNEWMGKSADPDFMEFVDEVYHKPAIDGVHDPYGGIMLKQSGYLDIPAYLDAMGNQFRKKDRYAVETIEPGHLVIREGEVCFKEYSAGKIIFCDGSFAVSNTFFDWLPFRPVKGELLEVSLDAEFPAIINRGVFVLHIGNGLYRIGSTYNNREPDWEPSEAGRSYILEKLGQLIEGRPQVRRHYAGVRPATADRRPVLGMHPEVKTIGLFNGLGTKGVSLSPWFGQHMSDHLVKGNPLMDDVNITRYFSLY